jgi:hypothetical protein
MAIDISAYADDAATVYLRWTYEVKAGAQPLSGWNLDDIQIVGTDTRDTTPPTIVSATPAANDTISSSAAGLLFTFSETVENVDETDLVLGGAAAENARVYAPIFYGQNRWYFQVTGLVEGALTCTLGQDADDIVDRTGNSLPATTIDYMVNFASPTMLSLKPTNGGVILDTDTSVEIRFSEPMAAMAPDAVKLGGVAAANAPWGHRPIWGTTPSTGP